jgi:hypothetical protein
MVRRVLAVCALLSLGAGAASAQPLKTLSERFYSPETATLPLPAAGVPALPKWTLKPVGAKPVMSSSVAQPGIDGPNAFDFAALGYVEEEYFLSGTANLYSFGGKGVVKADVPYTTRILIRRPTDLAKFSGNVIVEPSRDMNEWTTTWPSAARYMLSHGDVYVTFTMAKANLPVFFQTYDQERYAALDIPDEGVRWDIMAQTLGLVRSADGPLGKLGYIAEAGKRKGGLKVISTGVSLTGFMQASFIDNGHHARARRADGGPAVDGYLQMVSGRPLDPPTDAAVIAMISEGDALRLLSGNVLTFRTPDSDGPVRLRWYEIAGVAHANWEDQSQFTPSFQELRVRINVTPHCATPVSQIADKDDLVSAALANLETWIRGGMAPPPGKMLELDDNQAVKRDQFGNALGGLRPYWVAVPAGTISAMSEEAPTSAGGGVPAAGGLCGMLAHDTPLAKDKLGGLYKDHADYVAQVDRYLNLMVAQRYLLPEGAAREMEQAKAAEVP